LRGVIFLSLLPELFSVVNLKRPARAVGYYRALLRSLNYGVSRSRWSWWSRFQRLKAASLVPVKRNGNVGDSTWPSQN
jgi:hypothetical protein